MSENTATGSSKTGRAHPLRERLRRLVLLAAVAVIGGSAMAALAGAWWPFDLAVHFRPQYLSIGVACLIALLIMRRYRLALLVAVCVVANAWFVVPYYLPPRDAVPAAGPSVRVLSLNVKTDNRSYDAVCNLIRDEAPDIAVLQELDDAWVDGLSSLASDYPYRLVEPRSGNFGLAVYSRHPLETATIHDLERVPAVRVTVRTKAGALRIIAAHTIPPVGGAASRRRNDQLEGLASMIEASGDATLLVGDLNITPWSPHFRRLLADADLVDSLRGRGVQPSWPRPLPGTRIPIDHCLHTADVTTVDRRIGPPVGSDHLPLIVDVALSGARAAVAGG